ncbi:TPA: hypothetical protein N0F65_010914 [Lagenidium giganteum]|uniref:SAC3/GANP/THP3 conserved domain-containing protein n=1 Tax=Lagenidium giganteum TaxID=4803 RepID=A0AAV2Z093_9STRA|nr:TPA: hypothetical protein N0F65_010914 [Lagenidium giganteum]
MSRVAGRPPPPRPGMMPPPPPGAFGRPPPPRPGMMPPGARPPPQMRPPPARPAAPWQQQQQQWSNPAAANNSSTTTNTHVISAPPVRFNIGARGPAPRGPPPRTFAPPPATNATNALGGGNTKWPDSLHDYVKRAFARCRGAADQAMVQGSLKELITNAIMNNQLWTRNWLAEPLPRITSNAPAVTPNVTNPLPSPSAYGGAPPNQYFRPPPPRGMRPPGAFIPFDSNKPTKRNRETAEDLQKKNQRRQRFLKDQYEAAKHAVPTVDTSTMRVMNDEGDLDLEAMTIRGTCQKVEKEYLRLTSAPHPSTVRPEPVLKKALTMVKKKWKDDKCEYEYACSQLKSIRQDLTVQRIKNEFTVLVYETHARIALESGDINEFNQCQTQLHELYEKAIPGQAIEFLSYRILYSIYVCVQAKKGDSNAGQLGMYNVLGMASAALRAQEDIKHALAVREAVAMNNYHRFFMLYASAPNMAGYLMDPLVPSIRLKALRAICKAYRPQIPIDFVRQELHLKGEEGEKFINECGIVFVGGPKGERKLVDTKNSDIVWVLSDQSSLI